MACSCRPAPGAGLVLGLLLLGCAGGQAAPTPPPPPVEVPPLQLVETAPLETVLDHPAIPEAWQVWPAMIGAARSSLDLGQFYFSNAPGERLDPVITAVEAAAARGVRVRILAEKKYHKVYPETIDRLAAVKGIELRLYAVGERMGGGILHAKYFIVDGREAYVGSQNFDWRSLTHVQELGLRLRVPELVRALAAVFEADWAWAAGSEPARGAVLPSFPVAVPYGRGEVQVRPAFAPTGWLPEEAWWDLPAIIALIGGARDHVRVQLMSFHRQERDGTDFPDLVEALAAAAGRGVKVELLLADWNKRPSGIGAIKDLARTTGIAVKLVTIPQHSSGFIPFARVIHAKYMVVDGRVSWLGTSNWGRGYFHTSRNLGFIIEGEGFAADLEAFFATLWNSGYGEVVDPGREYVAPRIE